MVVDRTTKGLVAKCGYEHKKVSSEAKRVPYEGGRAAVDHVGVDGEVTIKARVSIVPNGGRRRDSVGTAERDLVGVV